MGKNVLVLGGGNVAIDVARSAVRLGCKVSMACLESREKMPSHAWEVQAALDEGITIHNDRTFERVLADENGRAAGVECMNVASFGFDEVGRLNVEKVAGSNHVIPCDTVIFSVGQRAGLAFIPDDAGVGMTDRKTIAINPNTYAATRPGVFAAGDSVSGTAFVIEAVASGHKAAESILRYLQGENLEPARKPELPVVKLTREEIAERMARGEIKAQPRVPRPELSVEQRVGNFAEVEGGYDDESAQREAARCLACGVCSECMSCAFACGVNAIDHDMVARRETIHVGAVILAPLPDVSRRFRRVRLRTICERHHGGSSEIAFRPVLQWDTFNDRPTAKRRSGSPSCNASAAATRATIIVRLCCMQATKEAVIAKDHQPDLTCMSL